MSSWSSVLHSLSGFSQTVVKRWMQLLFYREANRGRLCIELYLIYIFMNIVHIFIQYYLHYLKNVFRKFFRKHLLTYSDNSWIWDLSRWPRPSPSPKHLLIIIAGSLPENIKGLLWFGAIQIKLNEYFWSYSINNSQLYLLVIKINKSLDMFFWSV